MNKILIKFVLVLTVFIMIPACSKKQDGSSEEQKKKELDMQKSDVTGSTSGNSNTSANLYPQGSDRPLLAEDVENLDAWDLKIMRNEIYARHGYIFRTEEMKDYFNAQRWYAPKYENVDDMLTKIEKENIKLIKRYESRLGNNDYSR
jgi:hypothetical protein